MNKRQIRILPNGMYSHAEDYVIVRSAGMSPRGKLGKKAAKELARAEFKSLKVYQ
jgi:hypothetical protein